MFGSASFSRRWILAALGCAVSKPARADLWGFDAAVTLARGIDQLHALVIAHHGEIKVAEAFRGRGLDTPTNIKSVSKTFVSALVGAAIYRGELPSIKVAIAPYLQRTVPRNADPRVRQITIENLLTMQSGLAANGGKDYGSWAAGRHVIYDALGAPMRADPGTQRIYSTANTHILGEVLANATGMDLHRQAEQRIGWPLEIEIPRWTRDAKGRYIGGNEMSVSPMGLLHFGESYRTGGPPLVPPEYVNDSWEARAEADIPGHKYGLGWFLWHIDGVAVRYARGYGGQMIYVVPERGLTVVMTSDAGRPARMDGHLGVLHALFSATILPHAK